MQKKIRNSNIEILRIVAMLFVVMLHFNNHGANTKLLDFVGDITLQNVFGHLIESFCIVAVNCFVLISGLYGIRLKIKGMIKLYLQCFICALAGYLAYCIITGEAIAISILLKQFFALSQTDLWFVECYVLLYLSAPLLNYIITTITKKNFQYLLFILSLVTLYSGYLQSEISGESYIQFLFLYLVGRYVGIYRTPEQVRPRRWHYLLIYVVCCLGVFTIAMVGQSHIVTGPFLRASTYNSPLVIVASVALLLFFLSLEYCNTVVNTLASSVFTAYLLQENTYFGHKWLYPAAEQFFLTVDSIGLSYCYFFALSLSFLALAVLFDKCSLIIRMPLLKGYDILEQKIKKKYEYT